MKPSSLFFVAIAASLLSIAAFAESGTCRGTATNGSELKIRYFTNGYSDDNIDFYAKISVDSSGDATYALYFNGRGVLKGEATEKSRKAKLDFGKATLHRSSDNS